MTNSKQKNFLSRARKVARQKQTLWERFQMWKTTLEGIYYAKRDKDSGN